MFGLRRRVRRGPVVISLTSTGRNKATDFVNIGGGRQAVISTLANEGSATLPELAGKLGWDDRRTRSVVKLLHHEGYVAYDSDEGGGDAAGGDM